MESSNTSFTEILNASKKVCDSLNDRVRRCESFVASVMENEKYFDPEEVRIVKEKLQEISRMRDDEVSRYSKKQDIWNKSVREYQTALEVRTRILEDKSNAAFLEQNESICALFAKKHASIQQHLDQAKNLLLNS